MTLQAQDPGRPERRLTLLFIAVGGIFAFLASIFGELMLARLSGIKIPSNLNFSLDHPYLQIFGFLSEFVCGVGYSVVPLFKSRKLPNPRVAYVPFSLITIANILGIIAAVVGGSNYALLSESSSFLILASSAIFAYQLNDVLGGKRSKLLGEAEPFLSMAAISFVLVSFIFFASTAFPELLGDNGELFSPGFLYLSLTGFIGSMIFGVELRTVVFRMTNYKKSLARITTILQALSIGLAFFSTFKGLGFLGSPASISFLLSVICFAISVRIFERRKSKVLLPITSGRPNVASHNAISYYSDVCISSSILWLLFSCALGVGWLVFGIENFAVRDSFIHSIAIGFIGSAITAYGPVLLPGVLSRKAPKERLSLLPLAFLNASLIIRNAGNFYSIGLASLPIWESLSGLLVIIAMILLMNNMHFRRNSS